MRKVPKFSREGLNSEEFAAQHSGLWLPRVGSRRGGATPESRGPLLSGPRGARPPDPRGNRAAVAGAFVRVEQAPKGSSGKPAPARPHHRPAAPRHATPPRPRAWEPLPSHLLDGGGRDLPFAPLPRGCERHRHVAAEPATGESRALRGAARLGARRPPPGQSHLIARGGGGCSGAACIAGQAGSARSCSSQPGTRLEGRGGQCGSSPESRRGAPAPGARSRDAPPRPPAGGSAAPAASARTLRKWSGRRGRERLGRPVTGNAGPACHTVPNYAVDPRSKTLRSRVAPAATERDGGEPGVGSVCRLSTENADSLV